MLKSYKEIGGKDSKKREHVLLAEKALGRPLPLGAEVHHMDENIHNNNPTNLVICPSRAYHALLHQRMRAMDACGNPNFRKCPFCKEHDDPKNMVKHGTSNMLVHDSCRKAYYKIRDKARWQKVKNGIN